MCLISHFLYETPTYSGSKNCPNVCISFKDLFIVLIYYLLLQAFDNLYIVPLGVSRIALEYCDDLTDPIYMSFAISVY